jgi:hypothetical protein
VSRRPADFRLGVALAEDDHEPGSGDHGTCDEGDAPRVRNWSSRIGLCAVVVSAAWLEAGCDKFEAVVFVDDVDGVVFGVSAGDAECGPDELKLGHLDLGRECSLEDEGPPIELVVDWVLLKDAVDVHLEFVFDLYGQIDERFAHVG